MTVKSSIIDSAAEFVTDLLVTRLPEQYVFHTVDRTNEIVQACQEIGEAVGLKQADLQTVVLAAWFLHAGLVESEPGRSVKIATEFLGSKNYPAESIKKVVNCIQDVVPVQNPQSLLDEVLCDAESLHLAKKKYFSKSELLRVEQEKVSGKPLADIEWMEYRVQALNTKPFHTAYAREEYGKRRSDNLVKAQEELREAMAKKENAVAKSDAKEVKKELLKAKLEAAQKQPVKGVDGMFRIINRNNMTLNVLADRKANMLIHTNAIVLSITMSLLVRNLGETPFLIIPAILLVATCLTTIVISVHATRPRMYTPPASQRRITDLLFFGNFYKMDFKDYETGMNEVMSRGESLYGSLIQDAYNIGQVLGRKYQYIRAAYDVFMYGLILSVVSFGIAYLVHK